MMAEKRGKSHIRGYLLPILLLLALAAGGIMLLPVYRAKQKKQAELLRLQQLVAEKKAERNTRAQQTEALKNSPAAVEKVAREKYRFARDGETVLEYPALPERQKKNKSVQ
ncbi:MAG: septum formation initiator family protein [Lentisphaeria bacterium]|nr:septum formation initiator family protein [Lentisphaeria bacterium]